MSEIKPLTIEETALKEEMKSRCLNKGQYIDEKAEDKFKMLCHLEDFEIQYWELKDNWNKLKEWLSEQEDKAWDEVSHTFGYVFDKIQEIEGDINV